MKHLYACKGLFSILTHTQRSLKESKTSHESLDSLKKKWAQSILDRLNVEVEILGNPYQQDSTLFVGNHISYLDIPLLMACVDRISFVAKKELCHWPIFGSGAKQLDTVFVKRNNDKSRNSAKLSIQTAIEGGKRVVLFPSGTTSIDDKKMWKKGAFDIAAATQCPLQPFRITYEPLREVAYIDKDFFPLHLIKLNFNKTIKAKIEFAPPVSISDSISDCHQWRQWSNSPF